jgi:hypothetical protein
MELVQEPYDWLLTDMEKRIDWLCSEWADASTNDTHDDWRDLRMMIHGALQALNYCPDRHEDRMALMALGGVAFELSLDCISRDRYEGAE